MSPQQAYRPGSIPLRPLNFGEILDGAIKSIRHNPKVMVGVNAIVVLISTIVLFVFGAGFFMEVFAFEGTQEPDIGLGSLIAFYAGALASSAVLMFVTAITSISVGRSAIGQVASVNDAFQAALRRFPTVLVMTLIMSVGLFGGMTVVVFAIALGFVANPILGILITVLLIMGYVVLAMWVGVKLSIAVPAAVLEKVGPIKALTRSWFLTGGRFWMIFAILLVTSIITSVIQQVMSFPVMLFVPLLAPQDPDALGGIFVILIGIFTFIGMLISTVFLSAVTAVLYTDQRMRREGFDLTLTRAAQGQ